MCDCNNIIVLGGRSLKMESKRGRQRSRIVKQRFFRISRCKKEVCCLTAQALASSSESKGNSKMAVGEIRGKQTKKKGSKRKQSGRKERGKTKKSRRALKTHWRDGYDFNWSTLRASKRHGHQYGEHKHEQTEKKPGKYRRASYIFAVP